MTTTDRQPSTPAEALRWAADRLDNMHVFSGSESRTLLCRWADELDAAPTTYSMPAEPPESVTELWDRDGGKVERNTNRHGGWWYRGMVWRWLLLLEDAGPLSTVPPQRTEGGDA